MSDTLSAGKVSLSVKADTTHFGQQLHDGIMGGVSGLGKAVGTGILSGAAAVIAAGATVLTVGLKEAMADDAIAAQYAAGIKSTGNAANLSVEGMDNLAKSIALYSGQSDESIGKTEQLLQTFTNIRNVGPNKIFDQATVAAADMAAKMGGDASQNAIRLGRALNDPVKGVMALTRVGVQFTQAQKDQISAMVASGDTMGAQKVILGELQTEFGGAAKAAGQTLPGQIARSKVAFEQMSKSVVEGILPIVTPAITGIADAITKATPKIKAFADVFIQDVKNGIANAKPVIDAVREAISKVADFVTGTAVPAIKDFIQQFKDNEGAGGRLRTVLTDLYGFITGTLIPGFINMGKAVVGVVTFFKEHGDAAKALAVVVGIAAAAVGAAYVAKGIVAVQSAITEVTAWWSTATAANTSALIHKESIAQIIVGWIAQAVAATSSAAETVAIWAMYKWEAIQGAAAVVGAHLAMIGGWVASAAASMAGAIVMAAAWLLSIWPIALVIAAVIGLAIAIIANWDKIKRGASEAGKWIADEWNKVVDFFKDLGGKISRATSGMWNGLRDSFKSAINWIIQKWNDFQFTIGGGTVLGVTIPKITLDTPNIPLLAKGGTILPTPGGTLVRAGEAGRAETIVDTATLNRALDKMGNGAGASYTFAPGAVTLNVDDLKQLQTLDDFVSMLQVKARKG